MAMDGGPGSRFYNSFPSFSYRLSSLSRPDQEQEGNSRNDRPLESSGNHGQGNGFVKEIMIEGRARTHSKSHDLQLFQSHIFAINLFLLLLLGLFTRIRMKLRNEGRDSISPSSLFLSPTILSWSHVTSLCCGRKRLYLALRANSLLLPRIRMREGVNFRMRGAIPFLSHSLIHPSYPISFPIQ